MNPVAILNAGLITGVGLSAPATCGAIRCALDNVHETRFTDSGGEWIRGSMVHLDEAWRGPTKLAKMLVAVLAECVSGQPGIRLEDTPILLCLADKERSGRIDDLDDQVASAIRAELAIELHPQSAVFDLGRVGAAVALRRSRELIHELKIPNAIIAGVDSLLTARVLSDFEKRDRLLTTNNSDGFLPGEAAAAVLVGSVKSNDSPQLVIQGVGFGTEKATVDSELPLRANGLVQAIKAALAEAGCAMSAIDFRITDISGRQYFFKEAALALARCLTEYKKGEIDIWNPADCIGEVGAPIGVVNLAVCLSAMQKGCAPGTRVLCHLSNDDERRAALVLSYGPV